MNTILESHFRNESTTIVPLVKLLERRLEGEENPEDSKRAFTAVKEYKLLSETMDQEHRQLENLCIKIKEILKDEPEEKESYAVEQLMSLIKLEDEFVYTMANHYGETSKLNEFAASLDSFDFFIRVMP